jgi:Tol biopolymer transport system component
LTAIYYILLFSQLQSQNADSALLPLKPARTIEIDTDEGTWMSVDISPDGRTIVFDLLGDIYMIPFEGGEAKQITSGMAWDCQPRFSPDGRYIAFISDRDGNENLWIMDADGSNPRQITRDKKHNFGSPAWSPDGNYIVVRRYGEYPENSYLRGIELWMFHIKGGSGIQLTRGKNDKKVTIASGAVFSPDGKFIYFSAHPGRFQYNSNTGRFQVYRKNLETGELELLTSEYGGGLRPIISPDGKKLVYATRYDGKTGLRIRDIETRDERWLAFPIQRDDQEGFTAEDLLPGYCFTPDGRYVIIAYGGKIHRIDIKTRENVVIPFRVRTKLELGPYVYFENSISDSDLVVRQMRWMTRSPDGRYIAFSAVGKIWIFDTKKKVVKRLTRSNEREYMPSFSPDGKYIVYVSWSDKVGGNIWKISVLGKKPVKLTENPALYAYPGWSPDGKKIVFIMGTARGWITRDRSDIIELRWISADGGETHRITSVSGIQTRPVFSSDGERIFYTEREEPAKPGGMPRTAFKSIRLDGVDKRTHLIFEGTVKAVPSPDERWILFEFRGNAYLTAFPKVSTEPPPVINMEAKVQIVPVKQITRNGASNIAWLDNGRIIAWSFSNKFYSVSIDEVLNLFDKKDSIPEPDTYTINLAVPRKIPKGKVLLSGAKIITMKDSEIIDRGDILIENNRIKAVGSVGSFKVPKDAVKIDVTGKVVIPGFIDTHAHMSPQPDIFPERVWPYIANLAYGVTTVRDPSNRNEQVFAAQEMVEAGEILGPRIYSTGRAMFPWAVRINSLDEARDHVKRYKENGADYLKEYMQLRRIQRQWLVIAAMENGINITAEGGGDLKLDLTLAIDGYTGFEHSLPIVPIYKDVIQLIAKSKIFYTPTLVVSYGGQFGQYYWRQKMNIHNDMKLRRFTPHSEIDRKSRRIPYLLEDEYHFSLIARGARDILRAGGNVCLGAHGEQQGIGAHWELWLLASGGMTPLEALKCATIKGAECLGLQNDLGSIEPGKIADMIVLNSDPLEDIKNTLDIKYVIKNGEIFDGETLDQIWPVRRKFEKFYWMEEEEDLKALLNLNRN